MKITIYELLGMIKDGKAPKRIKYEDEFYYLDDDQKNYSDEQEEYKVFGSWTTNILTDEVEIIEDKKIEERLPIFEDGDTFDTRLALNQERRMINKILDKINEVE